jgi:membrane-bound hydrogenase subunit alpha
MSVILPIGPYHPVLKEAAYFKVEVKGERVIRADLKVGYNHRGIEELATRKTYYQNIFLCERVCGICSHCHSTCYCQTVEDLAGIEVPARARYIRTIVAELERLHSHFLWFGVAMHVIGYDTAFMHMWKERENIMQTIEAITGKRVNYAVNTIGGVRRDITPEIIPYLQAQLVKIRRAATKIGEFVTEDPVVKARTKDVGVLDKNTAKKMCVVGPTARASGVELDIRKDDPYAAYSELDWNIVTRSEGDVLARVVVRLGEIFQSINMTEQALRNLPKGEIAIEEVREFPSREVFDRVEAHRGELAYYIRSNGTNIPERVKIRTPSFMNNSALPFMLVDESIADLPLIIASIDPCYACNDRVVVVDTTKNKSFVTTLDKLARRRC